MSGPSYGAGQAPQPTRTALIMAGGTGGHVFPALAVASLLQARGFRIVWLGTRKGIEARVVPGHGFEMVWVRMSGMRANGLLRWFMAPFTLGIALAAAIGAFLRYRPDVVLGMGGYTAFPGGVAAILLGRPLVIHEQNSVAGLTNRLLACWAARVLVGLPTAFGGPKDKPVFCRSRETQWCGNPVRPAIAAVESPEARFAARSGPLRILVLGGSLGAAALNECVPQALAMLAPDARPQVVHQAGPKHLEQLNAHYRAAGVDAATRAFIDDMAAQYAWADLVICRAGALTLAELAAAGVGSVLVPYPYAVDDHQTRNALFLTGSDAAFLLPQSELSAGRLASLIGELTRERLLLMARAARALGRPRATEDVAQVCMEMAHAA
ncbi:MAG: undecaprenyldiphospho-muramoylpentapeptide beta-N-acetylglucosaminyltransferase [Betaproteobacteria bacterium]|nr:undecaprenyldiphospho-muramoylpentapeptide beta-N-acetylglucosaminyltransferase [Betaproteobacteria bacterium]